MSEQYELGKKMRIGAFWLYLQGGVISVVQFVAGIILARILDPADFGVFYAVTAYTVILGLQIQFKLPTALLQAKEIDDKQINASFWFMMGLALLCTFVVFLFAGHLMRFYNDLRYVSIMRLLCINFFIMPYMSINGTLLRRQMDFKIVSQIQVIVSLLSIVISISTALMGFGPYSLVISGIFSSSLSTILMYRKAPWRPNFSFKIEGLKKLLSYSWRLHLNDSLSMFANRIDNMLVGGILSVSALGIYNRSFNLSRMPVIEITSRLYEMVFTSFSRIQNDLKHTVLMYQKVLSVMTTAVYPFLLILIFCGDGIISVLYGEKWLLCITPLKIMALGSFPYVIAVTLGALADAQNLVAKETPIQIFNVIGTLIAVTIGQFWGLTGIAIGISIKSLLLMFFLQRMLQVSHIKLHVKLVLNAIGPILIVSIISAIVAFVVSKTVVINFPKETLSFIILIAASIFVSYFISLFFLSKIFIHNDPLQANVELIKSAGVTVLKKVKRQRN